MADQYLPTLHITQWREYGDDEDKLDVRINSCWAEYRVGHAIADEHNLSYPVEYDMSVGDLVLVNQETIRHGDILIDESTATGRAYRVLFEPVLTITVNELRAREDGCIVERGIVTLPNGEKRYLIQP